MCLPIQMAAYSKELMSKITRKGKDHILQQMVQDLIKEVGKVINATERELKLHSLAIHSKELLWQIIMMEKESTNGLMEGNTRVSGRRISLMAKVFTHGPMAQNMKVNLKMA